MRALDPEFLTFRYSCEYRGIPGRRYNQTDPVEWDLAIETGAFVFDDDEDPDGVVPVGEARFWVVPDAGTIDLLDALDAVDQEMLDVAEMLVHERPDLFFAARMDLGGDLLVVPEMTIDPRFRGHKTGHAVLTAILTTVARNTTLVVVDAAPVLADGVPEGSPQQVEARAALRRYWSEYGFQEAAGDYLALVIGDDLS